MKKFIKKAIAFVKEIVEVVVHKVVDFFKGVYHHFETVVILVLATFGLANLIGELPFMFTLPMWVESAFLAPVLAVIIIKSLIKLSEWRMARREAKIVARNITPVNFSDIVQGAPSGLVFA